LIGSKIKELLVLIVFLGIYGCGSTSHANSTQQVDFKRIIENKLDGRLNYIYNTDSTSVICTAHKSKLSTSFSFLVYSLSENVFLSDIITNVEIVKWVDYNKIGYRHMVGIVQYNEPKQPLRIIEINPTK